MCVLEKTLSILVNVFFKMNTLSTIFVHCLPKDGSFSKPKKLDFCNFSAHFPPLRSPLRTPKFFPFQGLASTNEIPAHPPLAPPHAFPLSEDRFAPAIPAHPSLHLLSHPPSRKDASGEILG